MYFAHFLKFQCPKHCPVRRFIVVNEIADLAPGNYDFLKKTGFGPKIVDIDPSSGRHTGVNMSRWSTPKVSNCVYGSSRIRIKCF